MLGKNGYQGAVFLLPPCSVYGAGVQWQARSSVWSESYLVSWTILTRATAQDEW